MTEHWHCVTGEGLDRPVGEVSLLQDMATADEARQVVVEMLSGIAKENPGTIDHIVEQAAQMPPDQCHILLGPYAFAVVACEGANLDECTETADREGEKMMHAYLHGQAMRLLLAMRAEPEATPDVSDDSLTGMYL